MKQIKEKVVIFALVIYEVIAFAVSVSIIINNRVFCNIYNILTIGIMLLSITFGIVAFISLIKYYKFTKKWDNDRITQVIILVLAGIIAILTLLSWFIIIKYKLI